ncbi:MAG: hypothetical protein ACTHKJ_08300, partial [Candidatus Nitrosocosmicus sp.]
MSFNNDNKDKGIFLQTRVIHSSFIPLKKFQSSLRSSLSLSTKTTKDSSINKVVVIGLGQLGLPVAKYVKERGFDTYGYDISQKAM